MKLFEMSSSEKIQALKDFARWAIKRIEISKPPRITFGHDVSQAKSKHTFGSTNSQGQIWVHVGNRNPADIMRTLCHELIHHKQFEKGVAYDNMDEDQRQYIEDEANAFAGRLMREYGQDHEEIYESRDIDNLVNSALKELGSFKKIIK